MRKARESVSVTVLHLEASRIALLKSDGNTQKPTPVYAIIASGHISHKIHCQMQGITYPRASTVAQSLTSIWKFCENFKVSRISADKRFLTMLTTSRHTSPDRVLARMSLPPLAWSALRSAIAKLTITFHFSKTL